MGKAIKNANNTVISVTNRLFAGIRYAIARFEWPVKKLANDKNMLQAGHLMRMMSMLFIVLGCQASYAMNAQDRHSIEDIKQAAVAFVESKYSTNRNNVTIEAGYLDPRLKLARCSNRLEAWSVSSNSRTQRHSIGVKCTGETAWKIYVPVNATVKQPVLVSTRPLSAGHTLTSDDVRIEQQVLRGAGTGYLNHPKLAIGQRLKTSIPEGKLIRATQLAQAVLIERGQSVTLYIQNNGLNIQMAGTALTAGTLNQRIKVKNLRSERVVEGHVRTKERVEVLVN